MSGPLAGVRVLDLTRYVAGPHATQMLGDFGADVAKIEALPGGDGTRQTDRWIGEPDALFFMMHNRCKRSVALDIRSDAGMAVLREMIATADVMIENYRPGVLEKMGLGWDQLQEINPRLVLVRVSGFGQDGPWAERASYDPVIQALSGFMELTGQPDGPPTVCGTVITDYLTALHAVIGTLGALQARERTGRGQWVDVSMLDGATSLLMTAIPEYLLTDYRRTRRGNKNPISVPSHTFRCGDGGYVHVTAWSDSEFAKLCRVMQREELIDDPRFNGIEPRKKNEVEIEGIIGDWMMSMDSFEVERRLLAASLPGARVATIPEVVENPQLRHRGHITSVEHPLQGRIPAAGPAVRFSATPPRRDLKVPLLGEHTGAVLGDWLGYDAARLDDLERAGAIRIAAGTR